MLQTHFFDGFRMFDADRDQQFLHRFKSLIVTSKNKCDRECISRQWNEENGIKPKKRKKKKEETQK